MTDIVDSLLFLLQRMDWLGVLDIALVAVIFFVVLSQFRGTQAATVLRGVAILIVVAALLTNLTQLPAFTLILNTLLPAMLFAVPVVFAPEIRRTLERLGRADFFRRAVPVSEIPPYLQTIVAAAKRLSERRHGALIVIERDVRLEDFSSTGVRLDADCSSELLLQLFFPNTPLHDGAAIVHQERILAAGCVVPLSSGEGAGGPPEHRLGLRHRAALGISEVSDAVAVVVSEETGIISVAHNGRMIRRLDPQRLQNILSAFTRSGSQRTILSWRSWFHRPEAKPTRSAPADGAADGERRAG
jgi:diadenylate cyclase